MRSLVCGMLIAKANDVAHVVTTVGIAQAVMGSAMLATTACGEVMQVPCVTVGKADCPKCLNQIASLPRLKRFASARARLFINNTVSRIKNIKGDTREKIVDLLADAIRRPGVVNLVIDATERRHAEWKTHERHRQISETWDVIKCLPTTP